METIPNARQQEMFSHIESWQQNETTQKAYCLQHEINPWVFQYWLGKYRKAHCLSEGFYPIHVNGQATENIRIHYPNGVEVQLPAYTGLRILQALISTKI